MKCCVTKHTPRVYVTRCSPGGRKTTQTICKVDYNNNKNSCEETFRNGRVIFLPLSLTAICPSQDWRKLFSSSTFFFCFIRTQPTSDGQCKILKGTWWCDNSDKRQWSCNSSMLIWETQLVMHEKKLCLFDFYNFNSSCNSLCHTITV